MGILIIDKNNTSHKRALGAQAVAAALAFSAPFVYAEQANNSEVEKAFADSKDVKCEVKQTDETMEKIRVHGVRSSVYLNKDSGDVRRIAALVDTPQVNLQRYRIKYFLQYLTYTVKPKNMVIT